VQVGASHLNYQKKRSPVLGRREGERYVLMSQARSRAAKGCSFCPLFPAHESSASMPASGFSPAHANFKVAGVIPGGISPQKVRRNFIEWPKN
jgi:hypothetical protein